MSVKSLVLVFVACFVSWLGAASTLIYTVHRAREERGALISFVCTAIDIQERASTPIAEEYARRFGEILADLGESCPPRGGRP